MSETHARRRHDLRTGLRERELDAMLVTDLLNVRYLTGFTGSNAALVVHAADEPGAETRTVFCTDGRYLTQAAAEVPDLEQVIERASALALAERIAAAAGAHRRTGFESHHVTVDGRDELADAAGAAELVRAPGLVERLRLIKDEAEVEALRMACAAADRALADLIEHGGLRPGRTELEVARELDGRMLDHGAAGPSFDTIVAAGANSAVPHHRPTDAVLAPGDFVKIDFGALVDGYHSDMTRTLVLGRPAEWQQEIYQLVLAAQTAGRDAVAVDADVREVDTAARAVIEEAGYGDRFLHGLGHGVGLEIHEAPALSQRGDGRIAAGMAVTVEPGVYLPERGGVRIEDTLVVRPGTPELLTLTTKELIAV
ncbi:Xaa-Pro dipeptidase [Saccharopolyspora erythraea NRRL 2338]|uniref:Xaa-Pro dipeptidase n=2 Tax=Saccharopolyspora erythraea TaxID=1836 RepID=A4FBF6_SACEN|nr:aminopeptidase P family protein [Saccharopolyspora erythraea]EQD84733.1 X-Pro dipeptidase [Saccharopolyspora erythraea D]PFG95162.1 Xaa-Pro dipeptidase [Saccharopolyspora erythraea NRRL 2338]QRK91829.1 aminopeptidase P family protein [Saccharopolyspora erythraea]CAM01381.1 Xaa-Pro dipeptidase [Saccharopolyspora erythraea NRRL 2338]